VLTAIAIITGTADIWLSYAGAKTGGAGSRALLYGTIGSIFGFFALGMLIPVFGNLLGGVFGYTAGVLLGQYQTHHDWNVALRASLGGLAGWGVATAVKLGGALLMVIIFIWQVLGASPA
jgi:uncharacterized protein YqgC (DUF456 family)